MINFNKGGTNMIYDLDWLKYSLLIFISQLLIFIWNTKFDIFPITNVEGNLEESYKMVQEYCKDKSFEEQVSNLNFGNFKYQYDQGNIITLPNIFLQRKQGDCDDFQLMNQFIQKYYGYTDVYIVYIKFEKFKLHYSTIIKDSDGYRQLDYYVISQKYNTIDDVRNFYKELYHQKTLPQFVKIVTFEEFLKILQQK